MMKSQKTSIRALKITLKCSICRADIKDNSAVYQSKTNYGIVCDSCCQNFSEEDIELVLTLFLSYGGYFGKFPKEQFSFHEALIEIHYSVDMKEDSTQILEINTRLLHRSLLHGLYPEQYQAQLKRLVDSQEYGYFL